MNKRKRVAILSLNMYTQDLNYACRVHSLAFQSFLEQHGIDAVILDYYPQHCNPLFDMRHPLNYYKEYPDSNPAQQKKHIDKWSKLYQEREERYDKIQRFIDNYFIKTDVKYTTHMLDYFDPGFDIYIAATDVLWKYRDNTGFDTGFFLQSKSMKGKGKITYAVSYGIKWDKPKIQEVSNLIKDIDYISVREKWLYDTLKKITDKDITIVLDPVFLQPVSFYDKFVKIPTETDYVLVYNVIQNSKTVVDTAVRYAERKGLTVIELSSYKENENFPNGTSHKVVYGAGIEEWLGYIRNAECIFTNSFHGCCFSIIFNKKFYVGERGGTKIPWLLEIFNLQARWIEPLVDVSLLNETINYDAVNALKDTYVEKSSQYILNAIEATSREIENHNRKFGIEKHSKDFQQIIKIVYNSTPRGGNISPNLIDESWIKGSLKKTSEGSLEYCESISYSQIDYLIKNCPFDRKGYNFMGWVIRARKNAKMDWSFLCIDGEWRTKKQITSKDELKIFSPHSSILLSQFDEYKTIVFVAKWNKEDL